MDDEDTVEVWTILLDGSLLFHDSLRLGTLSAAEQARAARMRAGPAREAFITTRAALRHILAGRLGMAAAQVPITQRAGGKPVLDEASGTGADLRFNVSHTRGIALCALAPGRELGVDVEWMDPALAWQGIAAAQFTAHEQAELARLPQPDQRRGFFAAWARKEARLKGLGTGFSKAASADITDLPAQPWTLLELQAGPEHAAALAVQGEAPCRLAYRLFSPPPMPRRSAA